MISAPKNQDPKKRLTKMLEKRIITKSSQETFDFGKYLGEVIDFPLIIFLQGQMGAGKTLFSKGFVAGMGLSDEVTSPTYTIVREYEGRLPLYHLDVYRIGNDPDSIDLDDYLYGDGVTVIEWGELLDEGLLGDFLTLLIEKSGDGRQISGQAHGPRSQILREEIFHD